VNEKPKMVESTIRGMKEKADLKRDVFLLTLLLLFHVVNNYIWLSIDTIPVRSDEAVNYLLSLEMSNILRYPTHSLLSDILTVDIYRPPLPYFTSALFYPFFGRQPDTAALMLNTIALSILLLSTYSIGKRLFNRNVGLLAAVILSFFPIVFGQSRVFMIDLFSAAMVTLCIYSLLLTNKFKDLRYSLLFGFILGLGLLSRSIFAVFVTGPILFILYKSISWKSVKKMRDLKKNCSTPELNLMISVFIGLSMFLMWCIPNKFGIIPFLLHNSTPKATSYPFVSYMLINCMSLFFLAVFVFSLLHLIVKYRINGGYMEGIYLLFVWIFVPYLIYSIISNIQPRYLIPILPAMALIISLSISRILDKKTKSIIIATIIIYCLIQCYASSYGIDSIPAHNVVDTPFYPSTFSSRKADGRVCLFVLRKLKTGKLGKSWKQLIEQKQEMRLQSELFRATYTSHARLMFTRN